MRPFDTRCAALAVPLILAVVQSTEAQKIYWAQSFGDRIRRADLGSASAQTLVEPPVAFDPIAVRLAGTKLYWAETFEDTIRRVNLDGTGIEVVLQPPSVLDPIAIDVDLLNAPNKVYWAQGFDDRILRANLTGTGAETIVQPPESFDVVDIAVDAPQGWLYWAENPGNRIHRARLNGLEAQVFLDVFFVSDPVGVAVDQTTGEVYWAERSPNRIRRASPDGLTVETVVGAIFVSGPVALTVVSPERQPYTGAIVYWAEVGNRIREADPELGVRTVAEAPSVFDPVSVDMSPVPAGGPPTPAWDCTGGDPSTCQARSRALTFTMVPSAVATAGPTASAIKVTMVNLEDPVPPNNNPAGPCCPPGNFIGFDTAANAVCTAGSESAAYRCTSPSDCLLPSTCPAAVACSEASGPNAQGSCARWVGPPLAYLESNDNPGLGNYRVSRLQCAPYYHDWSAEPNGGLLNVLGAEIVPSSSYQLQAYGSTCKGAENGCTNVSPAVTMTTRRAGDIATPFQAPGPPLTQPNAVDVANAVNKFRNLVGSPPKVVSQVQPNFPDPNSDINAIDIVTVVDNQRGFGYTYSGPCVCPSSVPCNTTACAGASACTGLYGAGATCIKTCSSGPRTGQPCNNNLNCGACIGGPPTGNGAAGIPCDANADCASNNCGLGVCPTSATPGFCRDRCGRCN
jgi:hypothetical protein